MKLRNTNDFEIPCSKIPVLKLEKKINDLIRKNLIHIEILHILLIFS
jgi:hypothetical protein